MHVGESTRVPRVFCIYKFYGNYCSRYTGEVPRVIWIRARPNLTRQFSSALLRLPNPAACTVASVTVVLWWYTACLEHNHRTRAGGRRG